MKNTIWKRFGVALYYYQPLPTNRALLCTSALRRQALSARARHERLQAGAPQTGGFPQRFRAHRHHQRQDQSRQNVGRLQSNADRRCVNPGEEAGGSGKTTADVVRLRFSSVAHHRALAGDRVALPALWVAKPQLLQRCLERGPHRARNGGQGQDHCRETRPPGSSIASAADLSG